LDYMCSKNVAKIDKKLSKFWIFGFCTFSNVSCIQHFLETFFELAYLCINEFGNSIWFFLDTPYWVPMYILSY
jgi:hypothetical protein